MAKFLLRDMFDKSKTMLGMCILGMAAMYGCCQVVGRNRGISDENPS